MTDLLLAQAAIKSRRQVVRDQSGQFRRRDVTVALKLAAERMKAALERDVPALEHAEGRYRVSGHWATPPGYVAPVSDEGAGVAHTGEVLPLFERAA